LTRAKSKIKHVIERVGHVIAAFPRRRILADRKRYSNVSLGVVGVVGVGRTGAEALAIPTFQKPAKGGSISIEIGSEEGTKELEMGRPAAYSAPLYSAPLYSAPL
jgi:hypothetical protein